MTAADASAPPGISRRRFTGALAAATMIGMPPVHAQARVERSRIGIAVEGKASMHYLPLTLAVFAPHRAHRGWTLASMLLSTLISIAATIWQAPVNPLFLGLGVSVLLLVPAILFAPPAEPELLEQEG